VFYHQIQRAKENVLPFIGMGLFIGILAGKASWFRSFGWLNDYFVYAGINTYYPDSGQTLFFNYFDSGPLTFFVIAIFAYSAFSRVIFGIDEKGPRNCREIIRAIENFGSLLATAWLGLILGIMLPTLIFQGVVSCMTFSVYAVYPLLFLIEISICTAFLMSHALYRMKEFVGRGKLKLGVRLEGLFLLGLTILMFTYEGKHSAAVDSFVLWAKSMMLAVAP
jgi:hypothetical protein